MMRSLLPPVIAPIKPTAFIVGFLLISMRSTISSLLVHFFVILGLISPKISMYLSSLSNLVIRANKMFSARVAVLVMMAM